MTTTSDRHRYAHATHTVMKLMDKEGAGTRLEEAVWTAVRDHSLGLCEYGRLIKEAEDDEGNEYTHKMFSKEDTRISITEEDVG